MSFVWWNKNSKVYLTRNPIIWIYNIIYQYIVQVYTPNSYKSMRNNAYGFNCRKVALHSHGSSVSANLLLSRLTRGGPAWTTTISNTSHTSDADTRQWDNMTNSCMITGHWPWTNFLDPNFVTLNSREPVYWWKNRVKRLKIQPLSTNRYRIAATQRQNHLIWCTYWK